MRQYVAMFWWEPRLIVDIIWCSFGGGCKYANITGSSWPQRGFWLRRSSDLPASCFRHTGALVLLDSILLGWENSMCSFKRFCLHLVNYCERRSAGLRPRAHFLSVLYVPQMCSTSPSCTGFAGLRRRFPTLPTLSPIRCRFAQHSFASGA